MILTTAEWGYRVHCLREHDETSIHKWNIDQRRQRSTENLWIFHCTLLDF